MQNSIFVSYNPNSVKEKDLAQGLYKKGRQNGFFIYLPERTPSNRLTSETKAAIDNADWFVIFSTVPLSQTVIDEINYALQKKGPYQIIVIYSIHSGRNITGNSSIINKFISFDIDEYDLNSLERLKSDIFLQISQKDNLSTKRKLQVAEETTAALKIILGIGAAALLLNALNSNNR
jgi:hypothetical protein